MVIWGCALVFAGAVSAINGMLEVGKGKEPVRGVVFVLLGAGFYIGGLWTLIHLTHH